MEASHSELTAGPAFESMTRRQQELLVLAVFTAVLVIWSGTAPKDRFTWSLEVFPVFIGLLLLVMTAHSFPLTLLVYRLLALHATVLLIGGHYTYAEVPVGYWVQDLFGLSRNHYDRLGHFVQGFVPALLVREILLRRSPLSPGKWTLFLTTCVCLAFSAFYELFEWGVARRTGESAAAFLGTQGDEWDTQWDMFLAVVGALTAQLLLSSLHDRQLTQFIPRSLSEPHPETPVSPNERGAR